MYLYVMQNKTYDQDKKYHSTVDVAHLTLLCNHMQWSTYSYLHNGPRDTSCFLSQTGFIIAQYNTTWTGH